MTDAAERQLHVITHNRYWRTPDLAALSASSDEPAHAILADTKSGALSSSFSYTVKRGGYQGAYHSHEWEQCFYILAGSMICQVEDGEPWTASAGDFVVMPPGVRHRNWNAQNPEPCVHLTINTPRPAS